MPLNRCIVQQHHKYLKLYVRIYLKRPTVKNSQFVLLLKHLGVGLDTKVIQGIGSGFTAVSPPPEVDSGELTGSVTLTC